MWEASSHAAINAQRLFVQKCPPLSVASYSFTQPSEVEQCGMRKPAQGLIQPYTVRLVKSSHYATPISSRPTQNAGVELPSSSANDAQSSGHGTLTLKLYIATCSFVSHKNVPSTRYRYLLEFFMKSSIFYKLC